MIKRAEYRCEYCLCPLTLSPDPAVLDHVIPRSQDGSDDPSNLALACGGCNNHKYTATSADDPKTGENSPLFNPRRDDWGAHFGWSRDGCYIVGLTAVGRATVSKLQLNREGVVNLRRLLRFAGVSPAD